MADSFKTQTESRENNITLPLPPCVAGEKFGKLTNNAIIPLHRNSLILQHSVKREHLFFPALETLPLNQPGDVVEVEIEGLGVLRNTIVAMETDKK